MAQLPICVRIMVLLLLDVFISLKESTGTEVDLQQQEIDEIGVVSEYITALDGEVKVDARKELKYIISPGYHTFDAAQQFCASKGWDLPAFNDSELYHQAVKIMEKEDLKSMWMGMKKITYDRFKWVDGTDFEGNFTDGEKGQCGRLKIHVGNNQGYITRAPCKSSHMGFICEHNDKVCPPGYIFGDGCYEIGQKVVSIETDIKQAYYTSQEKCYARKGKLLVLDNLVNLMKITELVFNEYEKAEIGLWIGLTASEFRTCADDAHLCLNQTSYWIHARSDNSFNARSRCLSMDADLTKITPELIKHIISLLAKEE